MIDCSKFKIDYEGERKCLEGECVRGMMEELKGGRKGG